MHLVAFVASLLRVHYFVDAVSSSLKGKSNSVAGAVQEEANLHEDLSVHLHFKN